MRSLTQYDKVKIFSEFLKLNDATNNFIEAYEAEGWPVFYKDQMLHQNAFDYFQLNIQWKCTSKGYDYWKDLSRKWQTYYKEQIK